jgi:pyruvate/2-oxoglutarate dehydrogenase complex dihydrolipoamide dehydrogenase (E3) component
MIAQLPEQARETEVLNSVDQRAAATTKQDGTLLDTKLLKPDICVIGAGSGGLSVAAACAALGVSVVLIEKGKMGGDCLNTGCVPSKALISAARRAHHMRTSASFGITTQEPLIDAQKVHDHIQAVIAAIAPNDSVDRFTALGVHVIQASARFIDAATVEAGGTRIQARRFVIATGSTAAIPPIPGLDKVAYFTNENIFENAAAIGHLIIIGGGPIGMEMAQAHRRLGARVSVLEAGQALSKDDPELTEVALKALRAEAVDIREGVKVVGVGGSAGAIHVEVDTGGLKTMIAGTHLLIATGRRPNIASLGLDAAGVKTDKGAISVDDGLLTANRRVFAIGDVVGGLQFTHMANYHAGIVIRRALFRVPAKVNRDQVPWVTFTDPELAQVGLTEAAAKSRGLAPVIYRWPFFDNDRAQAERATEGLIKVVCDPRGRILGAGIVGAHAGELIQIWSLAISQRLKIGAMTGWIAPYPTFGEISKRAAVTSLAPKAKDAKVRGLLAVLRRFG